MNQADAERRLEALEAKARHVDLRPLAMECGIAQEMGITVEQIRTEAKQVA
jgi:hypothetical protein